MASKHETKDEEAEAGGLLDLAKNLLDTTVLQPINILLSKTALRAYLTTFLVALTALVLFGFAITAYVMFYWSYIPRIGFERTVHLQFDAVYAPTDSRYGATREISFYPHGIINLAPDIVALQAYDVLVQLNMPRTPENIEAGNFMLEAKLYGPQERGSNILDTVKEGLTGADTALASSRRPAILLYRSAFIELAYKLTELHWYLLDWRQEQEKLRVSMFEGVEFTKGWRNVPATLRLEIQSTHRLQIYDATVHFRARFRGLRWFLYNYRILSAVAFVGGFWTTEVIFAGLAWAVLTLYLVPPSQEVKAEEVHEVAEHVKQEDDLEGKPLLSDTERTFPTSSGQQPLRYASPAIKHEEDDAAVLVPEAITKAAEADDEDEDEDADFFDSGLGTSLESGASRRESVRKRRGRLSPSEAR